VQVASVQDGDSLVVRGNGPRDRDGFRLRLYAIDAPESDQDFGREARDYLNRLVRGRTDLILEPVDTDRYGRTVGVLYYRKVGRQHSVNRLMVEQGLAWWYRQYGGRGLGLEHAEREAQRRRRGIWADGRSVAPWDHRRRQRERAARGSLFRTLLFATAVSVIVLLALYLLLPRFV
jgi:endonuclease YncB( thermonuclease family)